MIIRRYERLKDMSRKLFWVPWKGSYTITRGAKSTWYWLFWAFEMGIWKKPNK